MGSFTAIADVGLSLQELLKAGFAGDANHDPIDVEVSLKSPKDYDEGNAQGENTSVLSVYLYQMIENPDLRNQPAYAEKDIQVKPMSLVYDLFFMLTPFATDMETRHRIIGRAVQILHENSSLSGTLLKGQLAGTNEQIRITANPLSQDLISQIWQALALSTQLSAFYVVSPVAIESAPKDPDARVRRRMAESPTN